MNITKEEAYSLANFIDINLIDSIRNETSENLEKESMKWFKNVVHAYEKLCEYSGYEDKDWRID